MEPVVAIGAVTLKHAALHADHHMADMAKRRGESGNDRGL